MSLISGLSQQYTDINMYHRLFILFALLRE